MAKQLKSVFTDDLDHCYFTGRYGVERHHIFGGYRRKTSEKYGYILPVVPELHPNGVHAGQASKLLDLRMKQMAQEHYEANIGTREQFIYEFGKSYL